MERIALEDERKKTLSLQEQNDAASAVIAKAEEVEMTIRDALIVAQREAAMAREQLLHLEKGDVRTSTDPEQRLTTLLAEQRSTLEEAHARVRTENTIRINSLKDNKAKLEERVVALEKALGTPPFTLTLTRALEKALGTPPAPPRSLMTCPGLWCHRASCCIALPAAPALWPCLLAPTRPPHAASYYQLRLRCGHAAASRRIGLLPPRRARTAARTGGMRVWPRLNSMNRT